MTYESRWERLARLERERRLFVDQKAEAYERARIAERARRLAGQMTLEGLEPDWTRGGDLPPAELRRRASRSSSRARAREDPPREGVA